MEIDKTQVAQMPRASRSARPRFVLGVVLLILGLEDLLFMNIVLLPQVLAVETVSRPVDKIMPAEPPAQGGPVAAPRAEGQELAVAPALAVPSSVEATIPPAPASAPAAPVPTEQPPAALPVQPVPQVAQPAPAPAEPSAPPAVEQPTIAPSAERPPSSLAVLHFYRNSAWLSPEAKETLTKLAVRLKADSTLRVTLDGHTDDYGPERFNQMLSKERALRARARLEELGIAQSRLDIKAYGSEQPVDTEHTAKARARNRRVEIKLN